MNLEEVKEHFKDCDTFECAHGKGDIYKYDPEKIEVNSNGAFYIEGPSNVYFLTNKIGDFAKIITRKPAKKPIDNVTTDKLDIALKACGYSAPVKFLDRVIDVVEMLEYTEDPSLLDCIKLKNEWSENDDNEFKVDWDNVSAVGVSTGYPFTSSKDLYKIVDSMIDEVKDLKGLMKPVYKYRWVMRSRKGKFFISSGYYTERYVKELPNNTVGCIFIEKIESTKRLKQ